MTLSALGATALWLAQHRRWRVFPLGMRSKIPATAHGFLDATTDAAQIQKWWTQWPTANVGIRTGDGLVVVDIDQRNGGIATMGALTQAHGPLPPSYRVRTPGGMHHYFTYDQPLASGANVLGPGVDLKADGGYVVGQGSVHPSGGQYDYDVTGHSNPVALPAWIAEVRPERPRLNKSEVLAGLPEGQRDEQLFRYACWLRRADCPEDLATEVVVALGARCRPPMPRADSEAKVESAYRRYPAGNSSGITRESWTLEGPRE